MACVRVIIVYHVCVIMQLCVLFKLDQSVMLTLFLQLISLQPPTHTTMRTPRTMRWTMVTYRTQLTITTSP